MNHAVGGWMRLDLLRTKVAVKPFGRLPEVHREVTRFDA
jgi:hypothetical protein